MCHTIQNTLDKNAYSWILCIVFLSGNSLGCSFSSANSVSIVVRLIPGLKLGENAFNLWCLMHAIVRYRKKKWKIDVLCIINCMSYRKYGQDSYDTYRWKRIFFIQESFQLFVLSCCWMISTSWRRLPLVCSQFGNIPVLLYKLFKAFVCHPIPPRP